MLPCSTFSTRATRKISACGLVTENTPCNREAVTVTQQDPNVHHRVWPRSSHCTTGFGPDHPTASFHNPHRPYPGDGPQGLTRLEHGQVLENSLCTASESCVATLTLTKTQEKSWLLVTTQWTTTNFSHWKASAVTQNEEKMRYSPVLCSAGRTQGPRAQGSGQGNVPGCPLFWAQSYPAACPGQMEGSSPRGSQLKSCNYFSGRIMPSLGKRAQPGNFMEYVYHKKCMAQAQEYQHALRSLIRKLGTFCFFLFL